MGSVFIFSKVWETNGKWSASWHVGTRHGDATFDTKKEAVNYVVHCINRETGFFTSNDSEDD